MNKLSTILSVSFRPFFLLAALIAAINPTLWVLNYLGHINLPLKNVSPIFWHGHEMIFGFSSALIAGFILTASANWTSSAPYQGRPLLFLVLLWLTERVSYFLPLNAQLSFVLMNLFLPALALMLFLKLMNFPKQKYIFMPILIGLTIGKLLHSWGYLFSHEELSISGRHLAVGLIRLIILLIAGRVIPFFTRKRIAGLEISLPAWINPLSLLPIVLLALPQIRLIPLWLLTLIYIVAISSNVARQIMWKPHKAIKVPMLFVLHMGIAFISLGLMQELLGLYFPQANLFQAPLHMLMAGGLGTVGIAIMTRVSLGHTGRVIKADKWVQFAYLCIALGAVLRASLPLFAQKLYIQSLPLSSGLWSLGFLIFFIRFFKMLTQPRPDNKPY